MPLHTHTHVHTDTHTDRDTQAGPAVPGVGQGGATAPTWGTHNDPALWAPSGSGHIFFFAFAGLQNLRGSRAKKEKKNKKWNRWENLKETPCAEEICEEGGREGRKRVAKKRKRNLDRARSANCIKNCKTAGDPIARWSAPFWQISLRLWHFPAPLPAFLADFHASRCVD